MGINDRPPRYCAYLLRCWAAPGAPPSQQLIWRFSVEDPHTGARRGFATFEALVAFLVAEMQDESPGAADGQTDSD